MKTKLLFTLICLLSLSLTSNAQYSVTGGPGGLSFLFNNYYKNPDIGLLCKMITEVEKQDLIGKTPNIELSTLGFFSVAFANSLKDSLRFKNAIIGLNSYKSFFEKAYNLSQVKDTVLKIIEHSPSYNDMFWAGFFASGDQRYVEKVLMEAQLPEMEKNVNLLATSMSARWSLASNAINHKLVKKIIEETKGNELYNQEMISELLEKEPKYFMEQFKEKVAKLKK